MPALRTPRPRTAGRERIITAATALFADLGYRATSMRMIARRARCDVALAYHHFGSKEALYETIIRDYSGRYAGLFAVLTRPGTPEQRVAALVDGVIDFMRDNLPFVKTLAREVMAPSKVYTRTMQKNMRALLEVGGRAIADGVTRGTVAPVAPREFLLLAYGMISYYMVASTSLTTLFGESALDGEPLARLRAEAKAMIMARLGLAA